MLQINFKKNLYLNRKVEFESDLIKIRNFFELKRLY